MMVRHPVLIYMRLHNIVIDERFDLASLIVIELLLLVISYNYYYWYSANPPQRII